MSEQHSLPSQNDEVLPWWIRLCRWLWKLAAFLGTSVVLALLVNVISTWLTASRGKLPNDAPLHLLMTDWPLSLSVVCCLLLLAFISWLISRQSTPSRSIPDAITTHDRELVLQRLRFHYEQLLTQSLQGAVQMELGLVERLAAVHNAVSLALRLPAQADRVLPPHTSIIDAYEQAKQELLILGEPGSGKSTLLLELALHLVTQAERETRQPLPVLLPLSSWAGSRPALQAWLIEQFALLYQVPRKLSQQWIQAELVLPLLDGLDEMDTSARPACIGAINTYHQEHLHQLVVCSRTDEYDTAARHERLALHTAVVVQPLSREQMDAYLAKLGQPLAALRTALKKNPALAALATTPLMLSVLILTYQGKIVHDLPSTILTLQQEVLASYIEHMVERKGDVKRYPLHQTITYLHWLARGMQEHNLTIFYLEQVQPDWLPPRQIFFYRLSVGLVAGLILGLLFGLVGGLLFGLVGGLLFGLVGGLLGIIICGLLFGRVGPFIWSLLFAPDRWSWKKVRNKLAKELIELVRKQPPRIILYDALTWSWKKARNELIFALFIGLVFGLVIGLARGVISGLLYGLAGGLLIGLRGGFSANQFTERFHLSQNEGIRRAIKNGLFLAVIVGLLLDLIFGLVSGLTQGSILVEATVGLVFGLLLAMQVAIQGVVQHYILRVFFWRTQVFPWNAPRFLEDVRARILLRRVGGGYSFTHRLLLDYFADLDTTLPTAASPTVLQMQQQSQP